MKKAPLQFPPSLPNNLRSTSVIDLRFQLPINTKYTWESREGNRDVNALTTIVFHHDAYPKVNTLKYTDLQLAQNIARDHIAQKKNDPDGDPGFPYDAWIRNGIIYICNDLLPLKWGVASNNGYTVHICVSGEYSQHDGLTDADRDAMLAAYAMYKAVMPAFESVKGHKELNPSQCPGYDMQRVRQDISALDLNMSIADTPNTQMAAITAARARYEDLYQKAMMVPRSQYEEGIKKEAIRKCLLASDAFVTAGIILAK